MTSVNKAASNPIGSQIVNSNLNFTHAGLQGGQERLAPLQEGSATLTGIPVECLTLVLSTCGQEETSSLACVNKAFAALFRPNHENSNAADVLLKQITGSTRLSSLKTLRGQAAQLKALNVPHPEGKEWTISEVLKLYNLKAIDFSQEDITEEDLNELLVALRDVHESTPVNIRYLDLGMYEICVHEQLIALLSYCPQLEHLNICCFLETTNQYLFDHFSNPVRANCLVYYFNERTCPVQNVENFIRNQSRLEYFSLPPADNQSEVIRLLADICPRLQNLQINSNETQIDSAILYFAKKHPQLRELNFGRLGHTEPVQTALLIREIGKLCNNIKALSFYDHQLLDTISIDDEVIEAALDACPQLEMFFSSDAHFVTERSLAKIPEKWPWLQHIRLVLCHEVSISTIYNILKNCRQLKELYIPCGMGACGRDEIDRYLRLRILNRKLYEENLSGIEFAKEFKKLGPDLCFLVGLICVPDAMWDYRHELQYNPAKLKTFTKPFISLHGEHLLQQLETRQLLKVIISLIDDRLEPVIAFLNEPVKCSDRACMYYHAIDPQVIREGEIALENKRCLLYSFDSEQRRMVPYLERYKQDLLLDLAKAKDAYHKDILEAFSALFKDPEMTPVQLRDIFGLMEQSLKIKLVDTLSGNSKEGRPNAFTLVEQNVLCLKPIVDRVLSSLTPRDRTSKLPAAVLSYAFGFAGFDSMRSLALVSKAFNAAVTASRTQVKHLNFAGLTQELARLFGFVKAENFANYSIHAILREILGEKRASLIAHMERQFVMLSSLDLSKDTYIDVARVLRLLGSQAAQITSLDLTEHTEAENFDQMGTLCPNLTTLILRNSEVNDTGLSQIGAAFPHLTSLDLRECKNITEKGILQLLKDGKELVRVLLPEAFLQNQEILEALKKDKT